MDFDGGPEVGRIRLEEAQNAEALLLGRVTYEAMQDFWSTGEGEFADRLNEWPKYVVSSTLTDRTGRRLPGRRLCCGKSSTARYSSMAAVASRGH